MLYLSMFGTMPGLDMLWEATPRDNWGDFLSQVLGVVTYLLLYQDNNFHTKDNKDFFFKGSQKSYEHIWRLWPIGVSVKNAHNA